MHVETLMYSRWYHVVYVPSQYAPNEMVEDEEQSYLTCPGCGSAHKYIPHGEEIICQCELHMQRFGNALRIWR